MFRSWLDAVATLTLWVGFAAALWAIAVLVFRAIVG